MVLASGSETAGAAALRPKVDLLVQLGALLALGAATSSLRATVDRAVEAGATEAEIVGVLIAVAPDGRTRAGRLDGAPAGGGDRLRPRGRRVMDIRLGGRSHKRR